MGLVLGMSERSKCQEQQGTAYFIHPHGPHPRISGSCKGGHISHSACNMYIVFYVGLNRSFMCLRIQTLRIQTPGLDFVRGWGLDDALLCSSSDVVSVDEAAWEYDGRPAGWSRSVWSRSVMSWDGHSGGANNCTYVGGDGAADVIFSKRDL